MSHYLRFSAKTNRVNNRTQKTHIAKQNYQTSDDVHRIALRSPTLHQTNAVPQISFGLSTGKSGRYGGLL